MIVVSEPIANQLTSHGVPADRVYLVRNGFAAVAEPMPRAEARRLLDLPADARVVGWVGRLRARRESTCSSTCSRAFATRASSRASSATGKRDRERAHAERVGACIRWKGMVPMASRLYPAFDVLVQSSRTEGTPIALLEAIAAQTPVVATCVGGVPTWCPQR